MAGSEQSINSQAAMARPDLHVIGAPYYTALAGKWTIKQSSTVVQISGKTELNFPAPDQELKGYSTLQRLQRAAFGEFSVAKPGHEGVYNVNPADLGQAEGYDRSDGYIQALIRGGASTATIEEALTQGTLLHFAEALEVLGVAKLVAGTTPFGTTTVTLADVNVTARKWSDPANSTVLKDFDTARETLYWANLNTLYCGVKVANALRRNPELTALFGGTQGFGSLTNDQLKQALRLDYIYEGLDSLYGTTAIICEQVPRSTPGSPYYPSSTVHYCYDPQGAGQEYGLQYSEEMVAGSHGKAKTILAHAHCDVAINPYTGIRWTNTVA